MTIQTVVNNFTSSSTCYWRLQTLTWHWHCVFQAYYLLIYFRLFGAEGSWSGGVSV